MECCGVIFRPSERFVLYSTKEFKDRVLQHGSCPHCDSWVVELIEQRYDGKKFVTRASATKALKLFNRYAGDINKLIPLKKIKYGNKSNMAWRYGVTVPVKNGYNVYAVDFNGTRFKI